MEETIISSDRIPEVVMPAVHPSVPDEAGSRLVEERAALAAAQARRVPLQVGRHAQDELVVDLAAAAGAQTHRRHHRGIGVVVGLGVIQI